MSSTRVLTGITTTGTPHLGNYVGAIRPAIAASRDPEVDAYLFLADYHALIKNQNPDEVAQSSREIAATWLALGSRSGKYLLLPPVRYPRDHRVELGADLLGSKRSDEPGSRLQSRCAGQ
jgi:tryptophanyl-tRNA synthetase